MQDILTFLKIVFLGKTILLTPEPVELDENWLELNLNSPVSVVTGGASLLVQIPPSDSLIISAKKIAKGNVFETLEQLLPENNFQAILHTVSGVQIALDQRSFTISDFSLTAEDSLRIKLTGDAPLSESDEIKRISVKSLRHFTTVKIFWKNFTH